MFMSIHHITHSASSAFASAAVQHYATFYLLPASFLLPSLCPLAPPLLCPAHCQPRGLSPLEELSPTSFFCPQRTDCPHLCTAPNLTSSLPKRLLYAFTSLCMPSPQLAWQALLGTSVCLLLQSCMWQPQASVGRIHLHQALFSLPVCSCSPPLSPVSRLLTGFASLCCGRQNLLAAHHCSMSPLFTLHAFSLS